MIEWLLTCNIIVLVGHSFNFVVAYNTSVQYMLRAVL